MGRRARLHDPGVMSFGATLDKSAPLAPARAALLESVEGVVRDGVQPGSSSAPARAS